MPKTFNQFFSDPSIQILFATAPTGLGHIRVTEALKSELSPLIKTETIGIMNPTSQFLYRIVSQNLITRYLMEFLQTNPIGERVVAWFYTKKYDLVLDRFDCTCRPLLRKEKVNQRQ